MMLAWSVEPWDTGALEVHALAIGSVVARDVQGSGETGGDVLLVRRRSDVVQLALEAVVRLVHRGQMHRRQTGWPRAILMAASAASWRGTVGALLWAVSARAE